MCTLNVRLAPDADYPLVVIANRDEFYSRPSVPPSVISKDPAIFAPRDLDAGGTWFGVNEWGLTAAITNVWLGPLTAGKHEKERPLRSRGLLTSDVLGCKTVSEARGLIHQMMQRDRYQFFNLLVGAGSAATVFTHTGELKEFDLTPGSATILNAPYHPRVTPREELPPLPAAGEAQDDWLQSIRRFLSRHPLVCKHTPRFGTRSSQVAALARRTEDGSPTPASHRFWYADGPPCKTEFSDFSGQFQSVLAGSGLRKARV